jgi:hypothetical protein
MIKFDIKNQNDKYLGTKRVVVRLSLFLLFVRPAREGQRFTRHQCGLQQVQHLLNKSSIRRVAWFVVCKLGKLKLLSSHLRFCESELCSQLKELISENGTTPSSSVTKNLHGPFAKPPPVSVDMVGTLGFTASASVMSWEHFIITSSLKGLLFFMQSEQRGMESAVGSTSSAPRKWVLLKKVATLGKRSTLRY